MLGVAVDRGLNVGLVGKAIWKERVREKNVSTCVCV